MARYIDIHCHLAYGMDDGAKTLKEAQKMLRQADVQGVRVIIATPHVHPGMKPFDKECFENRLMELRDYCTENQYPITILSGAEIMYSDATVRLLHDGVVPTINGSNFILVEWYPNVQFERFSEAVKALSDAGYTTIVAHIERYRCLWYRAATLEKMKSKYDLRFQVDNEAFLDEGSFFMKCFVKALVKRDLIDYVASDAHDTERYKICMHKVYEHLKAAYGRGYARSLTWDNQLELIAE